MYSLSFLGEKFRGVVSFGSVALNGKAGNPISAECSKMKAGKKSLCWILYMGSLKSRDKRRVSEGGKEAMGDEVNSNLKY